MFSCRLYPRAGCLLLLFSWASVALGQGQPILQEGGIPPAEPTAKTPPPPTEKPVEEELPF